MPIIEIERAAGKTIPEIFADHGEAYFRDGERRVISRLIDHGPQVLATGGGAFINPETRKLIARARHLGMAPGRAAAAHEAGPAPLQPAAARHRRPGSGDAAS